MDKIRYEKLLYRIIQGRLRLSFGDLVLYIYEPDRNILEESFEIYDNAYKDAYLRGVFIKDELKEVLFEGGLWSPDDDRVAEKIEKQIEELKIECYKNVLDKKKLIGMKFSLRYMEKEYSKKKSKINSLDHVSCEGVAGFARSLWIISRTTRNIDGDLVTDQPLTKLLDLYNASAINHTDMRWIARNEPFRSMWSLGKKQGNMFDRPTSSFTKDQLSLCQYATMYDNVYESHESPREQVIDDDDCLDGWFISKRREYEKEKNIRDVESKIGNAKISNSQEVFVMANSIEEMNQIYDLNDAHSRNTINQRNQQIDQRGNMKFTELADIRQDIALQGRQQAIKSIKGK